MALASVPKIKRELGYTFRQLGFDTDGEFEEFIGERLALVASKVLGIVGATNYVSTELDVLWAEVYWTCAVILAREEKDIDEGFQLGDFILYPPRLEKRKASDVYREKAEGLLAKYHTHENGGGRIVALEPEEDTDDLAVYPADQMWLRRI